MTQPHQTPHHSEFTTFESRLATFLTWPPALKQKPEQMAKAGFFYQGFSDHVKCFNCNGALKNWEKGDSPEEEHAKWFPSCSYIYSLYSDMTKSFNPITNAESENESEIDIIESESQDEGAEFQRQMRQHQQQSMQAEFRQQIEKLRQREELRKGEELREQILKLQQLLTCLMFRSG